MSTSVEKLVALETAIDAFVASGMVQSYTIDGMTVTKTNFQQMLAYRDKLRFEAATARGGGVHYADLRGANTG
jgi:hypothetical protein